MSAWFSRQYPLSASCKQWTVYEDIVGFVRPALLPIINSLFLLLLWQLWPWREITKIQNVVNNDFARKGFCDYENFFFCHLVERQNSTREAFMNTVFVEFFRWAQRQLQSAIMGTRARVIRDRKFSLVLKRLKNSEKYDVQHAEWDNLFCSVPYHYVIT